MVEAAGPAVVVLVEPRLLSDAVRRALLQDGIATDDVEPPSGRAYDIAVVSPGREGSVRADRVLVLTADDEAPAGALSDLAALRSALGALVRDA